MGRAESTPMSITLNDGSVVPWEAANDEQRQYYQSEQDSQTGASGKRGPDNGANKKDRKKSRRGKP